MRTSIFLGAAVFVAAIAACSKKNDTTVSAADAAAVEATIAPVAIERLAAPSRDGASIVLGKLDGKKVAFIADEDTGTVRTIDLAEKREIGSVVLGGRPGQLLIMKNGQLAVAMRDDGSIALLDVHADGSLLLDKKTTTASEPIALALSPDDATLFVATGFSHALQAFKVGEDGALGDRTLDVNVEREPRAVSISSDGNRAFVAHAAASKLEVIDIGSAKIASATDLGIPPSNDLGGGLGMMPRPMLMRRRVMLDALIPISDVAASQATNLAFDDCFDCGNSGFENQFLPARFGRQGYALAHVVIHTNKNGDVETFIVPHTEVMTGDPMIISSGYGGGGIEGDVDEPTERFTMSMLDAQTGKRKLLAQTGDARDKDGCHLPRGSATDGTGNVYVACFGSDSIMAFSVGEKSYDIAPEIAPADKLRFEVDKAGNVKAKAAKARPIQKGYYLSMNRAGNVAIPSGPSGVAIDREDKRLVSFSQIDGSISMTPLAAFDKDAKVESTTIKLLRSSGLSEIATRGRKIFFSGGDARVSKDGRACSSCHPDGRDDGLVWSTPDGPRQTIMLAGRVNRQGPFGWLGKHPTLQIHMQTTMKNLKGTGLDASEQDALAAYLVAMKGPPTKWRALTDEESHGRDLFNSGDAQCSSCHAEKSGFTDHDTHDVRSATTSDQSKVFLVPSLANVGGSAPYFHDGRYASLEDLVAKTDGNMGATKQMNDADKKALVAYLRTL